jgi:hypothetical protein
MGRTSSEGGIVTGSRFIIYAARAGARSFFEGISDPTFFMTINKILDDGYYKQYEDPKHGEVFTFESLRDFVVHSEGLDIPDWLPFMKALQAQDNGSAAKDLYWRMVKLDEMLDPLIGFSLSMDSSRFAKTGDNQHTLAKAGPDIVRTLAEVGGNSAAYLAARLKKAGRDDLLKQIGPGKQHQSVRSAAVEAGIITSFPSIALKDPAPTAQKLLDKKGQEWCLQLLEELSELVL